MNNLSSFKDFSTDNKVNLHVCTNPKFKTNLIQIYMQQPLTDELDATKTALIPFVLYRGSKKYSTNQQITLRLEELYGASLSVTVLKRGENQLIKYSLELINEKYLPEEVDLFTQGIEFLYQFIFEPLVEEGGFKEKYLDLEKKYVEEEIKSLINDKISYALERTYQEMCKDEPYGIYKLGSIKALEKIDRKNLYQHYQKIVATNPLSIFVVGNIAEDRVFNQINSIFTFKHNPTADTNQTRVVDNVDEVRQVVEEAVVQQGKLTLGFRTGITRKDDLYPALLVYNGILGAFPHSKLFINVREKESLAYYAHAKLESTKGLLLITSGIQIENFDRAREIILKQVDDLAAGEISDKEFDWTVKGLINQLRSAADSNKGLAAHYLLGKVNNISQSIEEMIDKINRVSIDEVIKVGQNIKLDTIYFLRDKEAAK